MACCYQLSTSANRLSRTNAFWPYSLLDFGMHDGFFKESVLHVAAYKYAPPYQTMLQQCSCHLDRLGSIPFSCFTRFCFRCSERSPCSGFVHPLSFCHLLYTSNTLSHSLAVPFTPETMHSIHDVWSLPISGLPVQRKSCGRRIKPTATFFLTHQACRPLDPLPDATHPTA